MTISSTWIKGFKGLYKITPDGDVISFKQNKIEGKLLKPRKIGPGFLIVDLLKDGKHNERYVHRLVAEAFVPNPKPRKFKFVLRKRDDYTNNKYTNFYWSDIESKGIRQRIINKRRWKNKDFVNSKISIPDLKVISYLLRKNETHKDISKMFHISRPTLARIRASRLFRKIQSNASEHQYFGTEIDTSVS